MFVAGAGLFYAVFIARAEPVPLLYSLMALLISAAMMLIALFGHKQVSFRFVEGTYRVYDPVLGVFGKGEIRSGSLSEIYAIQLYRSLRTSDSGTRTFRYYSYEVNLVMPTGQRICVFYSGSQDQVEELASLLSKQLTLPVWKSY
ncbi:hypothetical protein SAMN02745129_2593 [Ferrimonas marina]|uniref:Uncharacterized protein n=2 Tax=Ferrimonas marina TaxID=299255 RepID=A0A1M5UJ04_9GAMM|nr:hypothetical protein SAMN02745129_2593 [Ferrimonas marina]